MHAFEFLRNASRVGARPIYVVSGDDAYLRDESLKAIVRYAIGTKSDELAIARFPGDQARLSDVLDELYTLPFLTDCRIVIVDGAESFVTAHRKELEFYAEKPSNSGVLVLSTKAWPAHTKLAKLVEKVGLSIECKSPDERDLPAWLIQLAETQSDAKLEEDAARLLCDMVGPEVGLLSSEVEKLAVYVGEARLIRCQDVTRMVGAGRVEKIFGIVDDASTGRASQSLADLDHLLGSGEHPIKIIAGMTYSLQKLHHAGQLRRVRFELKDACQRAGIYPGAVEKIGRQHSHLGPSRVDHLPALLLQADLDLKGDSQLLPRMILERLVVHLARPRQD